MNLVRPIPVVPGIYQLRTMGARVTVLPLEEGIALVDAGGRGSLGLISAGLGALGLGLDRVRLVVLTHYHPDHAGGLTRLVEATGAKVAVHQREVRMIKGEEPWPNLFHYGFLAGLARPFMPRLYGRPVRVDFPLEDGDKIPLAEEVRVIHTPGHTPGSICLYVSPRKVLIVGDALQYRFRKLTPPARAVTHDFPQAQQSLKKLLEVDFETICFSHFPPLKLDAGEVFRRLVQKTLT